jgi:hypothetical protein
MWGDSSGLSAFPLEFSDLPGDSEAKTMMSITTVSNAFGSILDGLVFGALVGYIVRRNLMRRRSGSLLTSSDVGGQPNPRKA